jgi:hypothetical protein
MHINTSTLYNVHVRTVNWSSSTNYWNGQKFRKLNQIKLKLNSWTYNFVEVLKIVLRVPRCFSIEYFHYKSVSLLIGGRWGGGNLLVEVTVNSKEERLLRLLPQLRPRIRSQAKRWLLISLGIAGFAVDRKGTLVDSSQHQLSDLKKSKSD